MPIFTMSVAFQEVQMSRTPSIQKHVGACETGLQKTVGLERSIALLSHLINVGSSKTRGTYRLLKINIISLGQICQAIACSKNKRLQYRVCNSRKKRTPEQCAAITK